MDHPDASRIGYAVIYQEGNSGGFLDLTSEIESQLSIHQLILELHFARLRIRLHQVNQVQDDCGDYFEHSYHLAQGGRTRPYAFQL